MKKWIPLFSIVVIALFLFISLWGVGEEQPESQTVSEKVSSATREQVQPPFQNQNLPPRRAMQRRPIQGRGLAPGPRNNIQRGPMQGRGFGPGPRNNMQRGTRPFNQGMGGGAGRAGGQGMGLGMPFDSIQDPERMRILRKEHPELVELIEKLARLRYQVDTAAAEETGLENTANQNRLKKKIQPLLAEEFDLEIERQIMEIDLMEKRLHQLRRALDRKKDLKDRHIERKMDIIIRNNIRPPIDTELMEEAPPQEQE